MAIGFVTLAWISHTALLPVWGDTGSIFVSSGAALFTFLLVEVSVSGVNSGPQGRGKCKDTA